MKLHLQVAEVAIQRAGIAFDLLAEGWDRIFDLEIPNLEHFEVRFALLGIRFWASYRLCNLEIPNLEHLEIRFWAPYGLCNLEIPHVKHLEIRFAHLQIRFWAPYGLCNLEIPNVEHLESQFRAPSDSFSSTSRIVRLRIRDTEFGAP